MIEVHHETSHLQRSVDVFVLDHRHSGEIAVMRLGETVQLPGGPVRERPTWEDVPAGVRLPEPTFSVPREVWEALAKAAADALPPSAATDRHLQDAIGVRDRLLTLAERAASPRPEAG